MGRAAIQDKEQAIIHTNAVTICIRQCFVDSNLFRYYMWHGRLYRKIILKLFSHITTDRLEIEIILTKALFFTPTVISYLQKSNRVIEIVDERIELSNATVIYWRDTWMD